MIDYSVVVSEQAAKDLNGIFEYIAYELKSFQNAQGQLSRLEKGISSLGNMPERFRRYKREPWYSRGLRIMPVDNFCVFYIPVSYTHLTCRRLNRCSGGGWGWD